MCLRLVMADVCCGSAKGLMKFSVQIGGCAVNIVDCKGNAGGRKYNV